VKIWLILNSLGLLIVAAVLFLLLRQMGFVLHRVGPVGARASSDGPRVGENIAHHLPELAATSRERTAKLILFITETCSVCREVKSAAEALAKIWHANADIFLIYDAATAEAETVIRRAGKGLLAKHDQNARKRLDIKFVPFGLVVDADWNVVGKGLINEISHLESLLELERSQHREKHRVTVQEGAHA
jgi:methylamine dehydrogenase accessory protein MauD